MAVAIRYENVFLGIIAYLTNRSRFSEPEGKICKTHHNVMYIMNGYLLFSKYAIIAYIQIKSI